MNGVSSSSTVSRYAAADQLTGGIGLDEASSPDRGSRPNFGVFLLGFSFGHLPNGRVVSSKLVSVILLLPFDVLSFSRVAIPDQCIVPFRALMSPAMDTFPDISETSFRKKKRSLVETPS